MKREKTEDSRRKFSEALKISWVRSSITFGLILLAIGLVAIFVLKVLNVGNTQLFLDAKAFVKDYGFLGIFCVTILAGTIVPLGSPALVTAAASFGLQPTLLASVATVGFTVGMMINYGLAYHFGRPYVMRKVGVDRLEEIKGLWSKWGWIIYTIFGFIPFLPVELFALFCGLLKTRLATFLVLSFTPRFVVFVVLAHFGEHIGGWIGII